MSENQFLLAEGEKYFFLDIPFYRTHSHASVAHKRQPILFRPYRSAACILQNIG
jgi:hypothetical protein